MSPEKQQKCDNFERFLLENDIDYKTLPNGQYNVYNNSKELVYTVWVTTGKAQDKKADRMTTLDAILPILECGKSKTFQGTIEMPSVRQDFKDMIATHQLYKKHLAFQDAVLVAVVQLPTGAKEIITNTNNIESKIKYYLDNYDDNFCLKTNHQVKIIGIMLA